MEPAAKALVAAGTAVGAALGATLLRNQGTKECLDKIDDAFPGSLTNQELVTRVYDKLLDFGFTKQNTILCTSLCGDEPTQGLEKELERVYYPRRRRRMRKRKYNSDCETYHWGGLAGFPWGGVTAFASFASQIPSDGQALVVFAPHVGVDAAGHVGTVPHNKTSSGMPCCEAAVAASHHVVATYTQLGESLAGVASSDVKDAQHVALCDALMPYAERLDQSEEPMVELPYALYDAQKEMITQMIQEGCGAIPKNSKVAVLGGIQINTPPGTTDYFIPLSFDMFNSKGEDLEDLTL